MLGPAPPAGVSDLRGVAPTAAADKVETEDEGEAGRINGDGGGRGIVRERGGVFVWVDMVVPYL